MSRAFLSAEWRHLAMVSYDVDPQVLKQWVPAGTELDFFDGKTFVTVVGFRFLKTKILGIGIPFHRDFEEVNLRFYVRARLDEGWRRGVVFVRELVPRRAIAWVARTIYGEPYTALPMRSHILSSPDSASVRYEWRRRGRWESLAVKATGGMQSIKVGSIEEFITEHYWGYTTRPVGSTEYAVEHPSWRISPASEVKLDADVASLYGDGFVECLGRPAASAFIAEGSPVTVRAKRKHDGSAS